jgi:glycine cleavage system aminomethyltransferase T
VAEKRTALFDIHKRMGARLIAFGGWEMPVEYSGISKEHTAVRTTAGLFDVSHMGEFEITGDRALDLVQHLTSNDARVRRWSGSVFRFDDSRRNGVDDLLVYRHADHFMLVVNAANTTSIWSGFSHTTPRRPRRKCERQDQPARPASPRAAQILTFTDVALNGVPVSLRFRQGIESTRCCLARTYRKTV